MLQRQVVLQRRPACAASAMCSAAMPRVHFSSRTVVPSAVRAAAPLACKASRRASVRVQALGMPPGSGLSPELKKSLDEFITKHKVIVFMKGTKQFPQCGFSNTVVQILNTMQVPFESVNILDSEQLRSGMKEYSQWPTFPQVYIDGEFYGGCDIMIADYQSGALKETLERVMME